MYPRLGSRGVDCVEVESGLFRRALSAHATSGQAGIVGISRGEPISLTSSNERGQYTVAVSVARLDCYISQTRRPHTPVALSSKWSGIQFTMLRRKHMYRHRNMSSTEPSSHLELNSKCNVRVHHTWEHQLKSCAGRGLRVCQSLFILYFV